MALMGIRNLILVILILIVILVQVYNKNLKKYRICVVDGKGGFKKSSKYCPKLDAPDSQAKCILGNDRVECLRLVAKDMADFSVFTSEDLIAASNSLVEGLITNELRYTDNKYEYEVVAVISNDSGIKSRYDLQGKKFCHPGYGFQTDWTIVLSNYMEASVIPQLCDSSLTLVENQIKASSEFWSAACKAGPWVTNTTLDAELKIKYKNLCQLCNSPNVCSTNDKYWGRRGALYCLTDGKGDVSWARLDDVKIHFGLAPGVKETSPDSYSFLCPDGTIRPLNTTKPCVWVVKPWDVVVSERTKAQDVKELISTLTHAENTWQSSLLDLIESYRVTLKPLEPVRPIHTYLRDAPGFLEANSFTECHPPRLVRFCTTSIVENNKCEWLREVLAAYGVQPSVDCLKAENTRSCMDAVENNFADVVIVGPDNIHVAEKNNDLKPLFYETTQDENNYITVGISRKERGIKTIQDLKGAKACFPTYDGIAFDSVAHKLANLSLINCPTDQHMASFFGKSCVPGLPHNESLYSLIDLCDGEIEHFNGESVALQCILEDRADVAFLSKNTLLSFLKSNKNKKGLTINIFNVICPKQGTLCYFSWAPIGQAMISQNKSKVWIKDALDMFFKMDELFGKNYKSLTNAFTLYGPFNGLKNLLFHDETVKLKTSPNLRNIDDKPDEYEEILNQKIDCNSSRIFSISIFLVLFNVLVVVLR